MSTKCAFVKLFEATDMERHGVHTQNSPKGNAEDETFSENFNRCLKMELIPDAFLFFSFGGGL